MKLYLFVLPGAFLIVGVIFWLLSGVFHFYKDGFKRDFCATAAYNMMYVSGVSGFVVAVGFLLFLEYPLSFSRAMEMFVVLVVAPICLGKIVQYLESYSKSNDYGG